MVVLVLERVFVVGGEVVAATTRVLAGRGRDLDKISVAINQETGLLFFGLGMVPDVSYGRIVFSVFRFKNIKRPILSKQQRAS